MPLNCGRLELSSVKIIDVTRLWIFGNYRSQIYVDSCIARIIPVFTLIVTTYKWILGTFFKYL